MKTKAIILSMVLSMLVSVVNAECYSEGIRVGVIQKFSQKGLISKSWEGELVMEGEKISGNSHGVRGGNVWKFSTLSKSVADTIDDTVMNGSKVALKYCQVSPLDITRKASIDTPYDIVKVVIQK